MTNSHDAPDIKVEITSAPAVKDMTITQVGQNMFSIILNIITVVRFPSNAPTDTPIPVALTSTPTLVDNTLNPGQLRYADGTTPQPDGETAAFNDFSKQHGYPPQTREVLAAWVQLQQGGA